MATENELLIVEMDLKYNEFIDGAGKAYDAINELKGESKGLDTEIKKLEKQLAIARVRLEQGDKAATQFALALELGSKGSKEQRQQIMKLTAELQDMDKANRVAGRSGFNLANVGYQIQDAMVQAQMGTSAFVIVAQQAPQLFAGMGGAASILGTVIAGVAIALSVLNPELADSKTAVEKFEEAMDSLNQSLEETSDGSIIVSEKIRELAKVSETAARVQLSLSLLDAKKALEETRNAVVEATTAYDDWAVSLQGENIKNAIGSIDLLDATLKRTGKTTKELLENTNLTSTGLSQFKGFVEQVNSELGTTTDQTVAFIRAVKKFQESKSPESMVNLANTINLVAVNTPNASKELLSLASKVNNAAVNATTASEKIKLFEELIKNLPEVLKKSGDETRKFAGAIKGMIESLQVEAETLGATDRERAVYIARLKGATEEELKAINAAYDKIEANEKLKQQQKEQLAYFEEQNQQDAEYIENQIKKEKAAQRFSDSLVGGSVSSDDPERFDREREQQAMQEQALLEQAKEYYLEGAYNFEQYQANLTAIGMQGAQARMQIAENEAKHERKMNSQKIGYLQSYIGAASTLANAFFEDNKALRAALIVADTAAGIARQFSDLPYPAALATSAAVAATGIAQLAAVNSSSKGSSAAPIPSTPATPEITSGQNITLSLNITGTTSDSFTQAVVESLNNAVDNGYSVKVS